MGPNKKTSKYGRFIVFLVLTVLFSIAFVVFRDHLSLSALARQEAALIEFRDNHLILVYLSVFFLYVLVTGLSVPGAATGLTLLIASYLGFWPAVVMISFASTAGATLALLGSRYLLRESIENRFGGRLNDFNTALERDGAWFLLTLRLVPAVPFVVINLVMGLTKMPVRTYWWVSQLGMLPGTCVYVFMGSRFSFKVIAERGAGGFFRWDVFIALALLGLFPLVLRKLIGSPKSVATQDAAE